MMNTVGIMPLLIVDCTGANEEGDINARVAFLFIFLLFIFGEFSFLNSAVRTIFPSI